MSSDFTPLKAFRIGVVTLLLTAITAFFVASRSSSADASLRDVATTNAQEETTDFLIAAPFWSIENGFVSTIEMKNFRVDELLTVTPVLYPLHGAKIVLDPITLNPLETRQININDALAAKNLSFTAGSAEIKYSHVTRGVFGANLMLLNAKKSLSYNFQFRMPDTSSHLEGVWWFYDHKTDGFVAVQNTTDDAVTATPTLYVNQTAHQIETLHLKAHEMQVVELRKELHQLGLDEASEGGIQINSSNVSAVIAEGGLTNASIGFSAPLLMHDTDTLAMRTKHLGKTLHALNVSIGADEPMMGMGLPAGTLMNPIINVRNIADKAIEVTPIFTYQATDQGNSQAVNQAKTSTQSFALPKVKLNAQETKRFEMLPYWQAGQIPKNVSWGSLEFSYTGDDGSLIATVTSVDQSGTYVFDAKIDNRLGAGFEGEYWSTEGNNNTSITIKNITKKPAKAWLTFQYATGVGKYEMPEMTLEPGEARMIDVKMLKMEMIPGANDEAFPLSATFGGMTLREEAPGRHFLIDAVIYNPETATCGVCGYGCLYPNSLGYSASAYIIPLSFAGDYLLVNAIMCNGTRSSGWECSCDFTSDDPSIATVDPACQARGTGMNPGSTRFVGTAVDVPGPACGDQTLRASCSVMVMPTITSISPARGLVGSTIGIAIFGRGFTPSTSVQVSGSGVSATVTYVSNTQLSVSFQIDPTAAAGNHAVTVTTSALVSNSVNFFVQIPSKVVRAEVPGAPGGIGPLQTPMFEVVRDLSGRVQFNGQTRCGVYRNFAFYLVDQEGQRIFQSFHIDEQFQCQSCPFGPQDPVGGDIPAGFPITDIQFLGFPNRCLQSGDRERFLQGFSVPIGSTTYDLTTIISIDRGEAGGLKVDSSIINP